MSTGTRYDLATARAALPILNQVTYLNTGTVGIMAEPVLARHLAAQADYERGGHYTQERARAGYEEARAALAALVNASSDEIALTRNATDGVALVAAGLALNPTDEVLTTSEEHPAVLVPWAAAERRGGACLRLFTISVNPEETLKAFEQALTTATRMVLLSHVSCETGVRLPVEEICRHCRERGILTLVDAAQSLGQLPVDVRAVGCDFMTSNGHKWLAGPKGTGFLFLRREMIQRVQPILVGDGSIEPRFDRVLFGDRPAEADWGIEPAARRFEYGTRNWHSFAALPAAIDYLASLGWGAIFTHVASVSEDLKRTLAAEPGVNVITRPEWSGSSGLVTFTVEGWDGAELSQELWQRFNIIQRRVQVPSAVRVSCAYFTAPEDSDHLVEALRALRR